MSLQCGIVGLPNVGKSTLFNALSHSDIPAENYPFCTVEPNTSIVSVPDQRLQAIADIVHPEQIIPATMHFIDIAGLVKGAAQGEGLGNQFLANIRETDAILHMVRCFDNDKIIHVNGQTNPIHDIEIINTELLLADLSVLDKALIKISKKAKSQDAQAIIQQNIIQTAQKLLDQGIALREHPFSQEEHLFLKMLGMITLKPVLYCANIADQPHLSARYLHELRHYMPENTAMLAICASLEAEIIQLSEEEQAIFFDDMGITETALSRLISAAHRLLQQHCFFTAGKKEVRAWTIPQGATAPKAAGVIHTDFEKGFIRAEVISLNDYLQCKGEQGAKEAGKMRLEGKDYIVQDGDVIHFRFNV